MTWQGGQTDRRWGSPALLPPHCTSCFAAPPGQLQGTSGFDGHSEDTGPGDVAAEGLAQAAQVFGGSSEEVLSLSQTCLSGSRHLQFYSPGRIA